MTQRSIDFGLTEVKKHLVEMAGFVEVAIDHAIQAFRNRNIDKISKVYEIESRVNEHHVAIDAECLALLATQQPLAGDLRFILSVINGFSFFFHSALLTTLCPITYNS